MARLIRGTSAFASFPYVSAGMRAVPMDTACRPHDYSDSACAALAERLTLRYRCQPARSTYTSRPEGTGRAADGTQCTQDLYLCGRARPRMALLCIMQM